MRGGSVLEEKAGARLSLNAALWRRGCFSLFISISMPVSTSSFRDVVYRYMSDCRDLAVVLCEGGGDGELIPSGSRHYMSF